VVDRPVVEAPVLVAIEGFAEGLRSQDLGRLRAVVASNGVAVDERPIVGGATVSLIEFAEIAFSIGVSAVEVDVRVLRDQRHALVRGWFGAGPNDPSTVVLVVVQVDLGDRITRAHLFELDHEEAAIARLDELAARAAADEAVSRRALDALALAVVDCDDALQPIITEDARFVDHRPLVGAGATMSVYDAAASMRSIGVRHVSAEPLRILGGRTVLVAAEFNGEPGQPSTAVYGVVQLDLAGRIELVAIYDGSQEQDAVTDLETRGAALEQA
jgi:hypothetical protein